MDQSGTSHLDEDEIPGLDEAEGVAEPSDDDIIRDAQARFILAMEAETEIRRQALDDLKFRSGEQWPDNIQQDRNRDGRPCLVINRLPQFVQQITNDQRQNRPSIKVHPVDDGADEDTGKVIQGIIRHIEYNSNADVAYDTAFESSVTCGFGYWRIITDFTTPDSFDQEILIKRIRDRFSVFLDPYSQEPDGSDAQWCFITEDLAPEEYRARYPDSKLSGSDWSSVGNNIPMWVREQSARVAEYFYKQMKEVRLHLLKTGEIVRDDELADRQAAAAQANLDASVVKTRIAKVPVIKWVKINGVEILEKTDWPGAHIPIVPVYGAELFFDGKKILESIIRNAKDSQRMYNYWASAETEAIALAPKAPYIVAEGQVEEYKLIWETANRRNHSYLPYKPTTTAGQLDPPPMRQAVEPAVQAITNARALAAEDLKATTGIYAPDPNQDASGASGVAIQKRNTQVQTSNFHFVDNLTRSLRHTGRILVDLIPQIYDTARAQRIVGDDGTHSVVRINERYKDKNTGEEKIYSLDVGRYDVTVDTGPSFQSKRQESAAAMQEITRGNPDLMNKMGDLMVKAMDWPAAQEMSDRLKKFLPPGVADDPASAGMKIPPQVQQHLTQLQQQNQALIQHLQQATQVINTKQVEENAKTSREGRVLASRELIEKLKIAADIEINLAKLGSQSSIALMQQQVAATKHLLDLSVASGPIDDDDETSAPGPSGGQSALPGQGAPQPTGGSAPGTPMEP